jgi:hypothetical protein
VRRRAWCCVALALFAAALTACGSGEQESGRDDPATVSQIAHHKQVALSQKAADRLGVQTVPVRKAAQGRTAIPYSAVLYDSDGATYAYTSPRRLAFVREPITVESVDGRTALLSQGPPVGTAIVSVGASEIWGVEYGGIKED